LLLFYVLFGLHIGFLLTGYVRYIYELRVINQVLLTVVLGGWLILRWRQGTGLPQTAFTLPLLFLCFWWLVTTLFAISPRIALERVGMGISMTILFFALLDLMRHRQQRKLIVEAVFMVTLVLAFITYAELTIHMFGLGIVADGQYSWLKYGLPQIDPPDIVLAQRSSNILAGLLVIMGAISIGWAMAAHRRGSRLLMAILTLLLLFLLPWTNSRGGYIALGIALATLGLFWLWQQPIAARVPTHLRSGLLIVLAIILVAGICGGILLIDSGRVVLWSTALQLAATHPVTGIGYGGYGQGLVLLSGDVFIPFYHAHNLYLNSLAETGIVGLLLIAWAGVALIRTAIKHWQASSGADRIKLQAVIAALIAFAFHNLMDTLLAPSMSLLIAVLVAYVVVKPDPVLAEDNTALARQPKPIWRWLPVGLAAVLVTFMVGIFPITNAYGRYKASVTASLEDPQAALEAIQEAQAIDPAMNLYPMYEAYLLGKQGLHDESVRQQAIDAYEAVLALEPTWAVGQMNLAALYEADGQLEAALATLEAALPYDESHLARLQWGRIAEAGNLADDQAIIDAYMYGMERQAPLASFWRQTPLRLQAVEQFAAVSNVEMQWRIWEAHDPSRQAALVPGNPQTAPEYWVAGQAALEAREIETARTYFDQAIALETKGDYYTSRALTFDFESHLSYVEHDLVDAERYGAKYFPSPYFLRSQLTEDAETRLAYLQSAIPVNFMRYGYTFIMFDRSSNMDLLLPMHWPGLSELQIDRAYQALSIMLFELETPKDKVIAFWERVLSVAPYDERVLFDAAQLGIN
ncbi:MAG: O-antigen ligase family protein, partial [Anaerolineae bacterium]|nr:O-antigen ligase family protein [Anaerolineae bacterium]